ncbi:DUF1127 domain-containing protein [Arenibaculum pallidiluteum]|uniref:DUF1127 domain-containing protein n=1 Tax=Arenibaculum pallidiluteum TaxID=2812559 RepID=UPI001A976C3E|nr:hypothetical protein [Arenibaculum pallidiluteum]
MASVSGFISLAALRFGTLVVPHGVVGVWAERRRYRRDLLRLLKVGPHMIDDVGLTVGEAEQEAKKPFWQA